MSAPVHLSDPAITRLQDAFPEYLISPSDTGACAVDQDGESIAAGSAQLLEVILADREFAGTFREATAPGHPRERPEVVAGWHGPRKVPDGSRLPAATA